MKQECPSCQGCEDCVSIGYTAGKRDGGLVRRVKKAVRNAGLFGGVSSDRLRDRIFTGHVSIGPLTIFGANAMHYAANLSTSGGYICFLDDAPVWLAALVPLHQPKRHAVEPSVGHWSGARASMSAHALSKPRVKIVWAATHRDRVRHAHGARGFRFCSSGHQVASPTYWLKTEYQPKARCKRCERAVHWTDGGSNG